MKIIENKKEYTAVDLLAKEIAKAADFNANKYEYDKTFICSILKNSTGVSNKLTDDEKNQLSECDEFWYYVRINGNFYKLECKDVSIAIDTEVKVTVPCNNWNKMFINFKNGTNTKYKRWVRPSDWLPLPKEVKDNEIWLLWKGRNVGSIIAGQGFDINDKVQIDWGDNSEIYDSFRGNSVSHTYTENKYYWCKITFVDMKEFNPVSYSIYQQWGNGDGEYYDSSPATIVEVICGNNCSYYGNNGNCVLEHLVTGMYALQSVGYFGLTNLQCLEFNKGCTTNCFIIDAPTYDIRFADTVIELSQPFSRMNAIKYLESNSIKYIRGNTSVFLQTYNLQELYFPNCELIEENVFGNNLYNLSKITVKNGCNIHQNSGLKSWVEIIYK